MEQQQHNIPIPDDFYCPISGELMKDPVSDKYGHSYEKSEIMKWLKINKVSPLTKGELQITDLKENDSLKRAIESIRGSLKTEQLKIKSRISEEELKTFIDSLNDIELNSYLLNDQLLININTPDIEVRPPVDLVLCIDTSYSMSNEATLKGEQNEVLCHGISILSLTVTAAKSILRSLNERDNISIITYSSKGKVLFEHVACTVDNKSSIESELDKLKPETNTNMWDGIHLSLDTLRENSPINRIKGVLLLTDGIPNVEPPRGHENTLRKYFRDHNFECMVMCYGFGYQLNSELLLNISSISNSDGFSFIPDASLLGNIFIHGISNLLTTAVYQPTLKISLKDGLTFKDRSKDLNIKLDSLKYGKEKNVLFGVDTRGVADPNMDHLNKCIEVTLTVHGRDIKVNESKQPTEEIYNEQLFRVATINTINQCIQKLKYNEGSYIKILNDLIKEMERNCKGSQYIENILFDLNGQVKEALNMTQKGKQENWFEKWGIHYLRSLQDAYKNEICNNFKDKGVSNFSSGLFNRVREEVSNIFDELPHPNPI